MYTIIEQNSTEPINKPVEPILKIKKLPYLSASHPIKGATTKNTTKKAVHSIIVGVIPGFVNVSFSIDCKICDNDSSIIDTAATMKIFQIRISNPPLELNDLFLHFLQHLDSLENIVPVARD